MKLQKNLLIKLGLTAKKDLEKVDENIRLIEIGEVIKQQREQLGISRTSLSRRTRISVTVIEALENGWKSQLPEKAYLTSMIKILEKELGLKKNTLKILINKGSKNKIAIENREVVTLASINFFSSWQGSLAYFIVMSISISLINNQQRYLSLKNTNTIQPFAPKNLIKNLKVLEPKPLINRVTKKEIVSGPSTMEKILE